MKFQKDKPARNKRYALWIITQPCCLTGMLANDHQGVDPHHVTKRHHGAMGGKPCDSRQIPVAHFLHCEMEDINSSEREVFERYGVDPELVILEMQEKWLKEGHKKFWR